MNKFYQSLHVRNNVNFANKKNFLLLNSEKINRYILCVTQHCFDIYS